MGVLDHSTKNIIVDAVLTDAGRAAIARQDGSFAIAKFALADDEVDYGIIPRYGRDVGKEKIEKNTIVTEAETIAAIANSHLLLSVPRQDLTHLPKLELSASTAPTTEAATKTSSNGASGSSLSTILLGIGNNLSKTSRITVEEKTVNNDVIDSNLIDSAYLVELDSRFLDILNEEPVPVNSEIKSYILIAESRTELGSKVQFTLSLESISNSVFEALGGAEKDTIVTYIKITGLTSGLTKEVKVNIKNSNL